MKKTPRPPATAAALHAVNYPGLGTYHLTAPQLAVVRELMAALLFGPSPEVRESRLLAEAGGLTPTLAGVFALSPAWGELVIPGASAGTYRLFSPPAGGTDQE